MKSSMEKEKQIFENFPLALCRLDENGKFLFVNKAFETFFGYSRDELAQLTFPDLLQGVLQEEWERQAGLILAGELKRQVVSRVRKDAAVEKIDVVYQVVSTEMGAEICMTVLDSILLPVPDENRHGRKQQDRWREQLEFLIENATDAVYIYDDLRQIIYANKYACQMTGYTKSELIGMSIADVDRFISASRGEELRRKAQAGNKVLFETEHIRKDGAFVPVEISLAVNSFDDLTYYSAFVRDISERKRASRESQELRFAIENTLDAVYLYDGSGKIHYANKTACEVLGYSRSDILKMSIGDLDPSFSVISNRARWDSMQAKTAKPLQSVHHKRDGTPFPVEINSSVTIFDDKEYAVAFVQDITERLKAQEAIREGEERFKIIADTSPVALIISRIDDGKILYANKQADLFFERGPDEFSGSSIIDLLNDKGVEQEVVQFVKSGVEVRNQEIMLSYFNAPAVWASLNTRAFELQGERVVCCVFLDITEARELSNQLSYQATYDDLTGLVNRREFEDRLQEAIEIAHERKTKNALCYLDLDQFKIINDTCGHMAGDELLRQLAQVLSRCVRRDDTLARLGGDEFAILLENCPLDNAERVAANVRQVVQDFRFMWKDNTFNIGVSIGLVPIATEGETITDVLRRADTACYAAKEAGRNRIHVFHFDDEELAQRHGEMQWVARINAALDQNRFELWQQRIVPITGAEGDSGHFELLLRMRDENGRLISPGVFLPAAERYDLAARIDRWVVHQTFRWFEEHPAELENLTVCAINLSGQSLSNVDFLRETIQLFQESRIPAHKICFEITETAAIANLAFATQFMQSLKRLGCSFSLDDFGSGLSSFAYLKNLPVDYVKIDGFFVKDIIGDPVDLAMVKAINDMAHAMGKRTIAEFVENKAILAALVELGVDYGQGYGIAVPMPMINSTQA
ncbi:MAG: EAL domain-containing protein [Pseudomonadales bacterium]|nr:EAL domain-containing protein [Pseudomonadales bacterium]